MLGRDLFRDDRRPVVLALEDRRRHLYGVGKTGTGKTTLIQNMIVAAPFSVAATFLCSSFWGSFLCSCHLFVFSSLSINPKIQSPAQITDSSQSVKHKAVSPIASPPSSCQTRNPSPL